MKSLVLWGILIGIILSGSVSAGQGKPGEFDSYVLSMSWQPAFCAQRPAKTECLSLTPGSYGAKKLVLHGLWPNKVGDLRYSYGFCGVDTNVRKLDRTRRWCEMPEPALSTDTKNKLVVVMPGVSSCLERHEWYRHGTCSGLSPDDYFLKAYTFATELANSNFGKLIATNAGKSVSVDSLLTLFERDFGPGSRKAVELLCDNERGLSQLSEVRLNLKAPFPVQDGLSEALSESKEPGKGTCSSIVVIDSVPER